MAAREIQAFTVTIPAGTPAAVPQVTNLTMPARIVERVEVVVPSGWNGLAGFALGAAGQPVIPYNRGAWIVASGETLAWDLADQISSGAWQLFGYNTGLFAHTLQIRFLLSLVSDQLATPGPFMLADVALNPAIGAGLVAGSVPAAAGAAPAAAPTGGAVLTNPGGVQ